jgi:hypothetical protein
MGPGIVSVPEAKLPFIVKGWRADMRAGHVRVLSAAQDRTAGAPWPGAPHTA